MFLIRAVSLPASNIHYERERHKTEALPPFGTGVICETWLCGVFRLGNLERWRKLLLLGIFPYLITGLVTASGGAWNASIVAEYFHFRGQTFSTVGLGALISQATDSGNSRLLLAATVSLAAMVVAINRLVWRRLYNLASTRFKLES